MFRYLDIQLECGIWRYMEEQSQQKNADFGKKSILHSLVFLGLSQIIVRSDCVFISLIFVY